MENKVNPTDKYFKYFLGFWLLVGLAVAIAKEHPAVYILMGIATIYSIIFYYYRLKWSWDNA
jgi:hypothetical protein